ncbi:UPF0481-like protein [Cinnamomum micranthum f. kanehirae]|uniref:UPF0481-like protein n=1 Tax=Cinnamomum micranthum f. kanehirae TaxID=337451 RepID=A0A3S3MZF0_9MAGN|nr:UPF0481-like protein [Cinnamomum micranthum f. kanehirae]
MTEVTYGADAIALDIEGLKDDFQDCVGYISSPLSDDGEEALHSFKREDLDPNLVSSIIGKSLVEPKIMKASYDSKSCSIYRVPYWLRKDNGEVYDPQFISIGPFHYEKREDKLRAMEEHKWRYLHDILSRKPRGWLEDCLATVKGLEQKARNCYSEVITTLDSNSFVEMMVLDGCFIVELFRKSRLKDYDFIVRLEWVKKALYYDLLLLENQIPFFILQRLSILIDGEHPPFAESAFKFLMDDFTTVPGGRIRHLLDLQHASYYIPFPNEHRDPSEIPRIPCASKLKEKGIRFRKRDADILEIKFENGVIDIPNIEIWGKTKILFLNLIALEQSIPRSQKPFTTHAFFMDCLIDTAKDVEILCQEGIISNSLGNEELVASLFNNMTREVVIFTYDFYLSDVFDKINQYSARTWPKLRASLVHDYFNNPWAIISFFAALLLLLLTMTQTFFASFPKFAFGK